MTRSKGTVAGIVQLGGGGQDEGELREGEHRFCFGQEHDPFTVKEQEASEWPLAPWFDSE